MKKHLNQLLPLFFITLFTAKAFSQAPYASIRHSRIVVTNDNFTSTGWEKSPDDPANELIWIAYGPKYTSDPTFEWGSAFLSRPVSKDPTLKNVRLRNNSFGGLKLSAIAELSYATYVKKCKDPTKPVAPVLILQVNVDGVNEDKASSTYSINFFPQLQGPSDPVLMNAWQEWDAFEGQWRFGNSSNPLPDLVKDQTLSFSLKDFIDYYKHKNVDVIILNTNNVSNASGGGIRLTVPGTPGVTTDYDDFEGYIDGFTLSTSGGIGRTYDFKYTGRTFKPIFVYPILIIVFIWGCFRVFTSYRKKSG